MKKSINQTEIARNLCGIKYFEYLEQRMYLKKSKQFECVKLLISLNPNLIMFGDQNSYLSKYERPHSTKSNYTQSKSYDCCRSCERLSHLKKDEMKIEVLYDSCRPHENARRMDEVASTLVGMVITGRAFLLIIKLIQYIR